MLHVRVQTPDELGVEEGGAEFYRSSQLGDREFVNVNVTVNGKSEPVSEGRGMICLLVREVMAVTLRSKIAFSRRAQVQRI